MNKFGNDFKEQVIKPSVSLVKWSLIIFILFFSIIALSDFVLAGGLNDGLVDYWSFNQNNFTGDISKTGTNTNTAVNTSGIIGDSRNFYASQYITMPTNTSYNLSAFTLCYNVYYYGTLKDTTRAIIFKGTTANYWYIWGYQNGAVDFFEFHHNNLVPNSANVITETGVFNITAGNWYSQCVTTNTTDVYVYFNNTIANASSKTGSLVLEASGLVLGRYSTTYLNGKMDEIAFWNRSLSATEISQYYNNITSGQGYPFPNDTTPAPPNKSIVLYSQNPSDITSINAVYGVNITYNITDTDLNVTTPYLNYSNHNSSGDIIYTYWNQTRLPAYTTVPYTNYTGSYYRFFLDDVIYPAIYPYYTHEFMNNQVQVQGVITGANTLLKLRIDNYTAKTINIFEAQVISNQSTAFTTLYLCNSSYTVGSPASSVNCGVVGLYNYTTYNHVHNLSSHNIFSFGTSNGYFGSVLLSNQLYFIFQGTNTGTIYYYRPIIYQNNPLTQTSGNNGNTWTTSDYIVNYHLHNYNYNDYIEYNGNYLNTTGSVLTSINTTDNYDITPLPPSNIILTLNNTIISYGETLEINRTDAINITGTITNYTYYIVENSTLQETFLNDILLKPINYTPVNMRSGYYYIKVITKTSDNLTSISLSSYFRIQSSLIEPCDELYTQNSTGAIAYFNWTTDSSITNTEIYAYNSPVYRVYLTSSTGLVNLLNLTDNTYTLYFNTTNNDTSTEYFSSGCTLEICVNNWVRQVYPCTDNLRYINYTDANNCPLKYYPSDTGEYEDCQLPATTDKNLWLLIILFVFFLVLLFIGLKYPYAYIGCLIVSIFLSVEMLSYFSEYKVIIMLLFPVITIIFGVFSFLINGRQ